MADSKNFWTANDMPHQDGRRVLVTGGVSGIGFQVARVMGEKGARVLIASRDAGKGQQALLALRQAVPGADFSFGQLDLANLRSIAEFSDRVVQSGESIDLLLNVAGVMAVPKRTLTVDGFEMHMGTNHLGHFALTGQLLPALKAARRARVVTVSAKVAQWTTLDLDDLQMQKSYGPMKAYGRSKLANVLFASELNRRGSGIGISSLAVDPGTAKTVIQRHSPGFLQWLLGKFVNMVGYPLDRVADPVIFADTVAEAGDATYIGPTKLLMASGPPGYIKIPKPALNAELRKVLWERSEELTRVHYSFS